MIPFDLIRAEVLDELQVVTLERIAALGLTDLERGDVRRCIELALQTWPEKTQQAIAEHVGCTRQYVTRVQNEFATSCELPPPATRTGKDGLKAPSPALEQLARKGLVALDGRGWRWSLTEYARRSLGAASVARAA